MANKFIIEIRTKGFKGADRDLDKIKKKTEGYKKSSDELRGTTSGLRRDIGALRNNLLLASFAFGAIIVAVDKVIAAYRRQIEAETKLRASLKNVRTATKQGADQLINLAAGYQKVTTFGDEVILSGMAMLATFQLNEQQIAKLTPRMLDMAAATGKDMVSSAMLLGKAFTGQASALTEAGVLIDKVALAAAEAEGPLEAFNFLAGELDKNFRGVAEALALTDIGKIDQMTNAISDINEEIGKMAVPLKLATSELQLFGTTVASFISLLIQQNATGLPGTGGIIEQFFGLKEALRIWKELNKEVQTTTTLTQAFGPQDDPKRGALPRPDKPILPLDPDAPDTLEHIQNVERFNDAMDAHVESMIRTMPHHEVWVLNQKKSINTYRDAAAGLLTVAGAMKTIGDASATEGQKFGAFVSMVGNLMTLIPGPWQAAGPVISAIGSTVGHEGGLVKQNGIQKFAHGGMVQGQDNVPILAQAGEFIMKREAVQDIGVSQLAQMNRSGSSGVTINVQGNMIGNESFVRDVLIPEISNAQRLNLA